MTCDSLMQANVGINTKQCQSVSCFLWPKTAQLLADGRSKMLFFVFITGII